MGKGGKREGAGRPRSAKDKKLRKRKKNLGSGKTKEELQEDAAKYKDVTKPIYLNIEKYLNKNNKELYKELRADHSTPLESLIALRDDLIVRYNFSRIAEMEGLQAAKELAILNLDELEKKGTIDGKKVPEKDVTRKKSQLANTIASTYPRLSTAVTTLAGEIRQMNELIDRIQADRDDLTINIFNILKKGKVSKKRVQELEDTIFTLPEDMPDTEEEEEEEEE